MGTTASRSRLKPKASSSPCSHQDPSPWPGVRGNGASRVLHGPRTTAAAREHANDSLTVTPHAKLYRSAGDLPQTTAAAAGTRHACTTVNDDEASIHSRSVVDLQHVVKGRRHDLSTTDFNAGQTSKSSSEGNLTQVQIPDRTDVMRHSLSKKETDTLLSFCPQISMMRPDVSPQYQHLPQKLGREISNKPRSTSEMTLALQQTACACLRALDNNPRRPVSLCHTGMSDSNPVVGNTSLQRILKTDSKISDEVQRYKVEVFTPGSGDHDDIPCDILRKKMQALAQIQNGPTTCTVVKSDVLSDCMENMARPICDKEQYPAKPRLTNVCPESGKYHREIEPSAKDISQSSKNRATLRKDEYPATDYEKEKEIPPCHCEQDNLEYNLLMDVLQLLCKHRDIISGIWQPPRTRTTAARIRLLAARLRDLVQLYSLAFANCHRKTKRPHHKKFNHSTEKVECRAELIDSVVDPVDTFSGNKTLTNAQIEELMEELSGREISKKRQDSSERGSSLSSQTPKSTAQSVKSFSLQNLWSGNRCSNSSYSPSTVPVSDTGMTETDAGSVYASSSQIKFKNFMKKQLSTGPPKSKRHQSQAGRKQSKQELSSAENTNFSYRQAPERFKIVGTPITLPESKQTTPLLDEFLVDNDDDSLDNHAVDEEPPTSRTTRTFSLSSSTNVSPQTEPTNLSSHAHPTEDNGEYSMRFSEENYETQLDLTTTSQHFTDNNICETWHVNTSNSNTVHQEWDNKSTSRQRHYPIDQTSKLQQEPSAGVSQSAQDIAEMMQVQTIPKTPTSSPRHAHGQKYDPQKSVEDEEHSLTGVKQSPRWDGTHNSEIARSQTEAEALPKEAAASQSQITDSITRSRSSLMLAAQSIPNLDSMGGVQQNATPDKSQPWSKLRGFMKKFQAGKGKKQSASVVNISNIYNYNQCSTNGTPDEPRRSDSSQSLSQINVYGQTHEF